MATKTIADWQKEAQALNKKAGKKALVFDEGVKIEDVQKIVESLGKEIAALEVDMAKTAAEKNPAINFEYYVAPGKSITAKRGRKGMLHEGEEIKADDLGGGLVALESLVKRDVVIANPNYKK